MHFELTHLYVKKFMPQRYSNTFVSSTSPACMCAMRLELATQITSEMLVLLIAKQQFLRYQAAKLACHLQIWGEVDGG